MQAFAVTEPESPCCTANLLDDQVIAAIPTDTGVTCNAICAGATLGGSRWGTTCDAAENAVPEDTLVGAKMVAVFDPPGGETFCHEVGNLSVAREYCAFGTDALGDEFYCSWDHGSGLGNLSQVTMLGATEGDVIQFWWNSANVEYNLDAWSTATFVGQQLGYQGDDQLIGSRANNAYYTDLVNGGVGEDRECGLDGDDALNGEGDGDIVCGDDGLDTLTGGGHDDILCGLGGNGDSLHAGPGDDQLSHGNDGGLEYNDGESGTDSCDDVGDDNCESDWGASDPCSSL